MNVLKIINYKKICLTVKLLMNLWQNELGLAPYICLLYDNTSCSNSNTLHIWELMAILRKYCSSHWIHSAVSLFLCFYRIFEYMTWWSFFKKIQWKNVFWHLTLTPIWVISFKWYHAIFINKILNSSEEYTIWLVD